MACRRVTIALAAAGTALALGAGSVGEAFAASRLGRDGGLAYGTLPPGSAFGSIIERHRPMTNSE
ncbi:MAG TPA: hypothetical protein VF321_03655 [Gaiellaceae bacterium]